MSKESEDTLRGWLAYRLKLEDVPQPLWERLKKKHYVSEALELPDPGRNELLEEARDRLKFVREMGGSPVSPNYDEQTHTVQQEPDLAPDDPVMERAEALSLYWAKLAAADRDVEGFRKEALEGRALSAESASSLVHSPAAALLSLARFKSKGVPLIDHGAELLEVEESAPFESPYKVRGKLRVKWPEGERQVSFSREAPRPPRSLPFWDGEREHLVQAWQFSVLGDLYNLATELSGRYPWEPSFAAWFVLTDEPPWVPPLTARASGPDSRLNHGTITITAAHWVPNETVSKLCADIKRRMNPAPTPSPRRLALFRFVVEHSAARRESSNKVGLDIPSWRFLFRLWNQKHPPGHPWHYDDVRNFRRDFLGAFDSLTYPFR